jgi:hypothetical protein
MWRRVFVVPLAAVSAIACSSSSGSGSASSASGFGQQFCQLLEPCCASAGLSTSGTLCEAFIQAVASKGTYNASAGQACINALQAASKATDFCTNLGGNVPQCNDVLGSGGNAGPGQPCNSSDDCAKAKGGSAICYAETNFVDGGTTSTSTCVQTQTGMAGQGPCVATIQGDATYFVLGAGNPPATGYTCDVADGVYCSSGTQNCAALLATGQPCTGNLQCATSDYCGFSQMGGQTCQSRVPVGSSCANGGTGSCAANAYCDTSSFTCQAQLGTGAACSTSQQCASDDCNNGKCSGTGNLGLALLCGNGP